MAAQVVGVLPENTGSWPVGAESAERVRGGYSVESLWLAAAADDVLNLPVGEERRRRRGQPVR